MYQLLKSKITNKVNAVKKDDVVPLYIPFDEANTDYQAYLKWLEEGNQPEPAETTE